MLRSVLFTRKLDRIAQPPLFGIGVISIELLTIGILYPVKIGVVKSTGSSQSKYARSSIKNPPETLI